MTKIHKKKYSDISKQAVYENSCDCIRYGYGFLYLNKCGLSETDAKEIWKRAFEDMASAF